jgi:diaminohydroxyphosphoribosylaminopyrimidine deaminase / 5-amino-6-(5-phosphoribosylamino)uracil reductase
MTTAVAFSDADHAFMREALALARSVLGKTVPNPGVGCVIVRDGGVVGRGATEVSGRPHAEAVALADAGPLALGADVYVTLEPCAHDSSRGPSCARTLVQVGVRRVVAAMVDPDPRTAGQGLDLLRGAGVVVDQGLFEGEAQALLAGFTHRLATGRPLVVVATDDGSFDADFALGFRETFEAALDRMGRDGLMRVRAEPGSPLALALASRGLTSD